MSSENQVIPLSRKERTVVLGNVAAWRRGENPGFQLVTEPVSTEHTLALPTSINEPEPPQGPDTSPGGSALIPDRQTAPVVALRNAHTERQTSPLAGVASLLGRLRNVTKATSESGQAGFQKRSLAKAAA